MSKRTLLLILVCIGVALGPGAWTGAGTKKELAFAVSLARKGLWREATFRFEALARKNPRNPRLWTNLAVAYEAGGRYEDAHRAYEEAALWRQPGDLEPLDLNRSSFDAFYAVWKQQQQEPPAGDANTEGDDADAGDESSAAAGTGPDSESGGRNAVDAGASRDDGAGEDGPGTRDTTDDDDDPADDDSATMAPATGAER